MDKKQKVFDYVKETAAIADDYELTTETLLFDEGLFDSMGFMSLVTFLQDEFNVEFGDDDLVIDNFESIQAMLDFISTKTN